MSQSGVSRSGMTQSTDRLRVYTDADVLLAGIATENPGAASRVILEASELTLLDLIASRGQLMSAPATSRQSLRRNRFSSLCSSPFRKP